MIEGVTQKVVSVHTAAEADALVARLRDSADLTISRLRALIGSEPDSLHLLSQLKFEAVGCDPLAPTRCLNVVEQLNQLFTYKASFQAARWLLARHPGHGALVLNLGTNAGTDIESEDGQVVAEVFATVDPRNNRKLEKDIERMRRRDAPSKYVFYLAPTAGGKPDEYEQDGILIRRLWP